MADPTLRLRSGDLHWQEVDGELIALEARASEYVTANPAGMLLWRALATGSSAGDLAALLTERYGLAPAVARADADGFLAQLAGRGLLEIVEGHPAAPRISSPRRP